MYNWYMEHHVGYHIPYPNVTNTRYNLHGEAAAILIVYHNHFMKFMEFMCDVKDKPALTNIEKHFLSALKDVPT
ncbi:uncharacterized protein LACBIDRAFT_300154 [Laccaria bicolor S238N-H82]|uniref:Predicted protein n=1 Tax=Laccaria bicolor (strain S238N-H82 / ATCC MYA-4686) TaxID=486041 RepID=B0DG58_LACBS|nr:uncharacterized protein LACBIDRAFT_300154 [Laccaria bicolor S238N-H82]EDR06457.1 predicted protein [Laccaria bicolor S238N-H82]|eukprot:XP_001882829.1 predicted protein [Laccaria bicolor S238N-H82]